MTSSMTAAIAYHRFAQSPLSPVLLCQCDCDPEKKREVCVRFLLEAYLLLNSRISNAKTATIATIMPTDTGMKYKSAADAGEAVGTGVEAGASFTFR